jgi:hypothetical protein
MAGPTGRVPRRNSDEDADYGADDGEQPDDGEQSPSP